MNIAEKIAYTYLRLNGFLLLPHFTVFGGRAHGHVDLVGLRAANSIERLRDYTFPVDEALFDAISELLVEPRGHLLGIVAEVRENANRDVPNDEQVEYVSAFLGGASIIKIAFFDNEFSLYREDDLICIGIRRALQWIIERIEQMEQSLQGITKTGSWYLSDDHLSDVLVLWRYGFLHNRR